MDLGHPDIKTSFHSFGPRDVHCVFYQRSDIMVLAIEVEVSVKKAIKLDMKRVIIEVVVSVLECVVQVMDIIKPFVEFVGGFELQGTDLRSNVILPFLRKEFAMQIFYEFNKGKGSEAVTMCGDLVFHMHILQSWKDSCNLITSFHLLGRKEVPTCHLPLVQHHWGDLTRCE